MHQIKRYLAMAFCAVCLSWPAGAQRNKVAKLTAAEHAARYEFDQAEEILEQDINRLKRRRQSTAAEEELMQRISKMRSMMNATERLTVVDSVVVGKDKFLGSIKLSEESGRLFTLGEFFNQADSSECTVYQNELGDKIYYSRPDEYGDFRLYTSDLVGGNWTAPHELDELTTDGSLNYPFMMSDGVTLYYASEGEGSIGGYDIFVTRYDMDEKKFLYPENVGMPYNSPANDYMMAIDEFNGLGWFATDRNQPEDSVCIYVFIPNDIRKVYDTNIYPPEDLAPLAQLSSIADTWGDKEAVEEARQRLKAVLSASTGTLKKKDFEFVIDDNHTYTMLTDFQSEEARTRMAAWLKNRQQMVENKQFLQELRDKYSIAGHAQRKSLGEQIVRIETQCEKDAEAMKQEEKAIRNMEISHLQKTRNQ